VIIERVVAEDSRVLPAYFAQNRGAGCAVRTGLGMASGHYLSYVAADDYFCNPRFFEMAMIAMAEHSGAAGVFGKARVVDAVTGEERWTMGTSPKDGMISPEEALKSFLVGPLFVPGAASIWKRSLFDSLGGFDETLGPQMDYFLNHAMPAMRGIIHIAEPVTVVRADGQSYSARVTDEEYFHRMALVEKKLRALDLGYRIEPSWLREWRARMINGRLAVTRQLSFFHMARTFMAEIQPWERMALRPEFVDCTTRLLGEADVVETEINRTLSLAQETFDEVAGVISEDAPPSSEGEPDRTCGGTRPDRIGEASCDRPKEMEFHGGGDGMNILITGACGYKGTVLVPKLLARGHTVVALDIMWFGNFLEPHPRLRVVEADVRDADAIELGGIDAIIHLASVANDPCGDLDPKLTWEIGALATMRLADRAVRCGVGRFIYASSGSVYGVKEEPQVTEDLELRPLSEYNKTKMVAERVLLSYADRMTVQIVRPATVCGYSPRMRLDVSVNMLTMQALANGVITVFGGSQVRPNIHIDDVTDLYVFLLDHPEYAGVFNAGFENLSISEIAERVTRYAPAKIVVTESNDPRSYRVNSDKLLATGFRPNKTVEDAIREIVEKCRGNVLADEERWYNLKWMQRKVLA
jgi:nucleoside-diphosphate-sugar epimerase/glycosyltransferase involved in cell wall biosynthesis